jgi:hypothetical protein
MRLFRKKELVRANIGLEMKPLYGHRAPKRRQTKQHIADEASTD